MAKSRKKSKGEPERDKAREERITMEIVVDAYNESERATGWYCHLEDKLDFPLLCRCIKERKTSPLRIGDEVEVVGMGPVDDCLREMVVEIPWEHKRTLAVPLSQLEVVHGDEETVQAVEDWHYWVERGYEF